MQSLKNYKALMLEEFNQKKAVSDALTWMENKYGKDLYVFKNIEGMDMNGSKTKTYDITVGEETYKLNLRKFDSNGDGDLDTVGFDVLPSAEEKVEPEAEL